MMIKQLSNAAAAVISVDLQKKLRSDSFINYINIIVTFIKWYDIYLKTPNGDCWAS